MKLLKWVMAGLALAALLSGCGSDGSETATTRASETVSNSDNQPAAHVSSNPRGVWTVLDARAGAENVGILTAQRLMYFEARGLHVGAGSPGVPSAPVQYVAEKTAELGIAQMPQVVMARAEGKPLVAVASLLPQPTAAMIWLPESGIHDIADLKGKTVAIPGVPFQKAFLGAVLARAGLTLDDIDLKVADYNLVPALVSGRADAIFGGSENIEGARLESRGMEPVITPVRDLGVPPYDELVVVARTARLTNSRRMLRNFTSAMAHGTAAAVEDPELALEAIEKAFERDSTLSQKTVEAQVEATLPLLSTSGYIDPEQTARLVAWMHDRGMIEREVPVSQLLTNRFVQTPP